MGTLGQVDGLTQGHLQDGEADIDPLSRGGCGQQHHLHGSTSV
jgi:hypothetical protein